MHVISRLPWRPAHRANPPPCPEGQRNGSGGRGRKKGSNSRSNRGARRLIGRARAQPATAAPLVPSREPERAFVARPISFDTHQNTPEAQRFVGATLVVRICRLPSGAIVPTWRKGT
eukprot:8059526-Pyramimonas_sp.AAC.1